MGVLTIVHLIGQGVYEGSWVGAHAEQRGSNGRSSQVGMCQRRDSARKWPVLLSGSADWLSLQNFCPQIYSLWFSPVKPGASFILTNIYLH